MLSESLNKTFPFLSFLSTIDKIKLLLFEAHFRKIKHVYLYFLYSVVYGHPTLKAPVLAMGLPVCGLAGVDVFHVGSRCGSFFGSLFLTSKLSGLSNSFVGVNIVGGGDMEKAQIKKFSYKKECTVMIDVGDDMKMAAGELISFLSQQVGDVIRACVPKGPNHYEVTIDDVIQARSISDIEYLECNGVKIRARLLHSETVVVSFLHLPAYIRDEEIEERLKGMNIEILTRIYRRYYKGTKIADGTRYVRVKFPPEIKSLPYSMKFKTVESVEYFRVLHNNQLKVCYNCMSDSHVIK